MEGAGCDVLDLESSGFGWDKRGREVRLPLVVACGGARVVMRGSGVALRGQS